MQKTSASEYTRICARFNLPVSGGMYYVGSTENLEKRLAEHQRGEGTVFTKAYLPVKLVYTEEYARIEVSGVWCRVYG